MRGGWKLSEETKIKMSLSKKGIPKSADHRRQLSEALIGHTPWNKGKTGIQKAWNKGKKCEYLRGSKHWNWHGGASTNRLIRTSWDYSLWRRKVFTRDNFTCIQCGYKSKGTKPSDIHADHIKPFALYPELRLDVNNGRTLCRECHSKTESYCGKKFTRKLKVNQT